MVLLFGGMILICIGLHYCEHIWHGVRTWVAAWYEWVICAALIVAGCAGTATGLTISKQTATTSKVLKAEADLLKQARLLIPTSADIEDYPVYYSMLEEHNAACKEAQENSKSWVFDINAPMDYLQYIVE